MCYHSPYYESCSDESSSSTDAEPKARRVKRKYNGKRKERRKTLSSDGSQLRKDQRKHLSSGEPFPGIEGTEEEPKAKRAKKEKVKGKGKGKSSRQSTISASSPSSEEQPRKRRRRGVRSSHEREDSARAAELG